MAPSEELEAFQGDRGCLAATSKMSPSVLELFAAVHSVVSLSTENVLVVRLMAESFRVTPLVGPDDLDFSSFMAVEIEARVASSLLSDVGISSPHQSSGGVAAYILDGLHLLHPVGRTHLSGGGHGSF